MRYSANNRVVSFALLGPGILCAAALYLKAHLVETQARLPLGRYTAERVIQRSEPLYEFLVLHPEKVSLTAFRMETFSRSGTVRRAWEVEASDPMQRMLVHFSWDADTGELRSVTAASQPLDGGKFRIDNKDAAVRNARYWMDALGFAQTERKWRLNGIPERGPKAWIVRWEAGKHKVHILLNAVSSRLIKAESYWTAPNLP